MVVQCQAVSPENIRASNIIWTVQVVFRNICAYTNTYLHVIITDEKEAMNLKKGREECMRGFGGREGNRKIL